MGIIDLLLSNKTRKISNLFEKNCYLMSLHIPSGLDILNELIFVANSMSPWFDSINDNDKFIGENFYNNVDPYIKASHLQVIPPYSAQGPLCSEIGKTTYLIDRPEIISQEKGILVTRDVLLRKFSILYTYSVFENYMSALSDASDISKKILGENIDKSLNEAKQNIMRVENQLLNINFGGEDYPVKKYNDRIFDISVLNSDEYNMGYVKLILGYSATMGDETHEFGRRKVEELKSGSRLIELLEYE